MRREELKNDFWGVAVGLFAAVSQTVLLRESLSLASGNELSTGISFAGWFAGVVLGALSAGRTVRILGSPLRVSSTAGGLVVFGFLLLRLHRVWLGLLPGQSPSLLALAVFLFVGLGFGGACVGSLFTQTSLRFSKELKAPVSRLFIAESIGSVLGSILFYSVLADTLPHLTCLFFVVLLLWLTAAFVSGRMERVVAALLAVGAGFALVSGTVSDVDFRLDVRAFKSMTGSTVVASRQTPYGRLALTSADGQFELWSDGRLDYVFPDPYERPVWAHLAMTAHPNPKTVLLIGGGPSDRLDAVLSHRPDHVVLTFLNRGIIQLCKPFWSDTTRNALADPRVQTVNDDGRRYAAESTQRFDVVIVSSPPPRSAGENRFHTASFYRDIAAILKPGGIVAVTAPGSANVMSDDAAFSAASTLATLRTAFGETVIVPGLDSLILGANEKGVLTTNVVVLASRYKRRMVRAASFSERRFAELLDPGRMQERRNRLMRVPARVNTDDIPIIYTANLGVWERSLGNTRQNAAETTLTALVIRNATLLFVVPLVVLVLWPILAGRTSRGRQFCGLVSLGTTGALGMVSQIVIMLTFQASMGTLYTAVALLNGMFMFGLTIGGTIARRGIVAARVRDAFIVDGVSVLFLLLVGLLLTHADDAGWLYYLCSGAAGTITGAAFLLYLSISASTGSGDERDYAAAVETADHLGAGFGAAVTGVVWIPAFGVAVTCIFFAILKGASSLSWFLLKARQR